jgi:hypothetical protein
MLGTGFSFPLTKSPLNVLRNILIFGRLIYGMITNPVMKSIEQHRKAHGLRGKSPWIAPLEHNATLIVFGSVPEVDYPLQVVPDNVIGFGPIMPRALSASTEDSSSVSELSNWLNQAPTIVINLGSLFRYDPPDIVQLSRAVCNILLRYEKHQVLWKVPALDKFKAILDEMFSPVGGWEGSNRIKITNWVEMSTCRVLEHETVVVNVNHGGANSYYEAMYAGVPQIILAQWVDLYDNAVRVEWLGIGTYGNRSTAPYFSTREFEAALEKHVNPSTNSRFRERAKECMEACKRGGGMKKYADVLMEISSRKDKKH